ncbi:hypothetical protein [Streptomyces cavernae]|nr:hypothetical protein [Streptomyces cavernae]
MPTPFDHEFVRAVARPAGGQARTRRVIPTSHGMATSGMKG